MPAKIDYNPKKLADFCQRWQVRELALFGSVLREDFRSDSDVDVMVTFEPGDPWSYWDWPKMICELEGIFGRKVDFVEKRSIQNPFRKHEIMNSHEVVYAA